MLEVSLLTIVSKEIETTSVEYALHHIELTTRPVKLIRM